MITEYNINTTRQNSAIFANKLANQAHAINDDCIADIRDFRADFDKLSTSTFSSLHTFSKGDIDNLIIATKLNIKKGINLYENKLILKVYNNFI